MEPTRLLSRGAFTVRITMVVLFVAAVGAQNPKSTAVQGEASRDPFVLSCDRFPVTVTEAELRARYGSSNVTTALVPDYWGAEGNTTDGVALLDAMSNQRLELAWFTNRGTRQLWMVRTSTPTSRWRTSGGVTVGMDLRALEALNGRPFVVGGFEGDEPSSVQSWSGGRLANQDDTACRVVVSLEPPADGGNEQLLVQLLNRELAGEATFSSDDRAVRALNPRVIRLMIRR